MGMLDRYKKKGGFIQLLNLIETSGKTKQDQFLGLIAQESKAWEEGIKKYMLNFDRIMGWEPQFRAEILTRVQPMTVAAALHGTEPAKLQTIISCLGTGDQRKIMQAMSEKVPTPAEKSTCIVKILTETRGFCKDGTIKLEKVDPELAVPENIEELLAQNPGGVSSAPSLSAVSSDSSAPSGDLVFPEFDAKGKMVKPTPTMEFKGGNHTEEIDFLKKKVNQLTQEINHLKHDLKVAHGKLEQIKKIA
jgi:hypothetical protein